MQHLPLTLAGPVARPLHGCPRHTTLPALRSKTLVRGGDVGDAPPPPSPSLALGVLGGDPGSGQAWRPRARATRQRHQRLLQRYGFSGVDAPAAACYDCDVPVYWFLPSMCCAGAARYAGWLPSGRYRCSPVSFLHLIKPLNTHVHRDGLSLSAATGEEQ